MIQNTDHQVLLVVTHGYKFPKSNLIFLCLALRLCLIIQMKYQRLYEYIIDSSRNCK